MRGKPSGQYQQAFLRGITPAGAGKTEEQAVKAFISPDHPRRCGENEIPTGSAFITDGSPPQVRGKPGFLCSAVSYYGITPAGAGKTDRIRLIELNRQDHPRRCGENSHAMKARLFPPGSPPQVRGKPFIVDGSPWKVRITPAGAGKTKKLRMIPFICEDHPRRCGENEKERHASVEIDGSPPQVRGKPSKCCCETLRGRITPAGAGKTPLSVRVLFVSQDHPRRCGENKVITFEQLNNAGSPPQVRGKQGRESAKKIPDRITPAGAGKTRADSTKRMAGRDHPRRCGENGNNFDDRQIAEGSPPQVRGKPHIHYPAVALPGITPAGAGKTNFPKALPTSS